MCINPYLKYFSFLAVLLLFTACANITRPTGGDKDEDPPILDLEASTPNFQTNFSKKPIQLFFDEWLKLNNPVVQIVVTPPLDYKFDVALKKKSVVFKFNDKEVLKENATYTINFGEAIKDLNEGNTVPDLRFVFSTGPYIDSLEVNGIVVDAATGAPANESLVLLYEDLADSVFRTKRPFYFAKTDKDGKFKIPNVRADTFKVCALKNDNLNYIYDQPSEEIGFLEAPIIVSDSLSPELKINLFKEVEPLRLIDTDDDIYGLLKIVFNQEPEGLNMSWSNQNQRRELLEEDGDTLKLWYAIGDSSAWKVYLNKDSTFSDTLLIKAPTRRNKSIYRDTFQQVNISTKSPIKINPNKALRFEFNHPIAQWDTSLVRLSIDSLNTPLPVNIKIDSSDAKVVLIEHQWIQDSNYNIQILPGGIIDFYGMTNDTLEYQYRVLNAAEIYGSLTLNVSDLDSSIAYVLQLMFKGSNLVEERVIQGDTTSVLNYPSLPAGEYTVQVIEDLNGNGKWDTGSYDLKRQPERRMSQTLEELRADWEVNAEVKVKQSLVQ